MKQTEIAPVALFIFNRPGLTAQVFDRVRAARPPQLLVVADGPRSSRAGEAQLCEEARKIATSPDWPCEVRTNFAVENMGCRRRVSSGLDWVFQECEEAIILEDDCVPCGSFFTFGSEMLRHYRGDERIMHVSGINFQDGLRRGPGSYYFSRYSLSWGWASWRRAWQNYDVTLNDWPRARTEGWLSTVLEDPIEIDYWTRIFDKLHQGQIDTWDYQWLFKCWRRKGLCIHPNENLVTNIGVGPDATHFKANHRTLFIPTGELEKIIHPAEIARDAEADRFIFSGHILDRSANQNQSWLGRMKKRLGLRTRLKGLLHHTQQHAQ